MSFAILRLDPRSTQELAVMFATEYDLDETDDAQMIAAIQAWYWLDDLVAWHNEARLAQRKE